MLKRFIFGRVTLLIPSVFALVFLSFSTGVFVSSQYLWAETQKKQVEIWKGINANAAKLAKQEEAIPRYQEQLREARNAALLWRWDAAKHGSRAAIDWPTNRVIPLEEAIIPDTNQDKE